MDNIYDFICILLFLVGLLFLVRYIRNVEGFANPSASKELYDIHTFFKPYPIAEICPIYNDVFQKVILSQKLDLQGKAYPNDIALEKAIKTVNVDIMAGPLQCPFQLPQTNDLDASLEFVRSLDPNILSKAMNTLLFCAVNVKTSIDNTNDVMLKRSSLAGNSFQKEGFITECSNFEMEAESVVPLQCIRPDQMKATEKEEIDSDNKLSQQIKQGKKIEITKKLLLITKNYTAFMKEFQEIVKAQVTDLSEKFLKAESNLQTVQTILNKTDGGIEGDERVRHQKVLDKSIEEKMNVEKQLKKMTLYQTFQDMSMTELIEITKKNQMEFKTVESKIKTGEISF